MPKFLSIVATSPMLCLVFVKEVSVTSVSGSASQFPSRKCHYLVMELNNGGTTK
jgi:hypothetical protein